MNRSSLRNLTHNAGDRLTPSDPVYKQWIFRYTFLELEKDLGALGDITSDALFPGARNGTAIIYARAAGIIAGLQEIEYFLVTSSREFRSRAGDLAVTFLCEDGASLKPGQKILKIHGEIKDILKVERTVLNLLSRMSGVATLTREFVNVAPGVLVTPTRKTLWGLLDKRACVLGGAGTHRLSLEDAILVKDTHRAAYKGSLGEMLVKIMEQKPAGRFLEVEVEEARDAVIAAETYVEWKRVHKNAPPLCIMYDNFTPSELSSAVKVLRKEKHYDDILLEASGGVTQENITEYASSGVDIISIGALTHSSHSMDFGMEME